jgi:hypothetical protein
MFERKQPPPPPPPVTKSSGKATYVEASRTTPGKEHVALSTLVIEIEIVYNMYRMHRFTPNTRCAGCCLWALPTMSYKKLTSQG